MIIVHLSPIGEEMSEDAARACKCENAVFMMDSKDNVYIFHNPPEEVRTSQALLKDCSYLTSNFDRIRKKLSAS